MSKNSHSMSAGSSAPIRVLFVCLGNICRSPTAHGIFQALVDDADLSELIHVDSAGTSGWHIGSPPDQRTMDAAMQRGFDLSSLQGRQASSDDFRTFDYILAMDESNLHDLKQLRPEKYKGHLGLFLSFGNSPDYHEVPDPYHAGERAFELVLDLVEDACKGLLLDIQKKHT